MAITLDGTNGIQSTGIDEDSSGNVGIGTSTPYNKLDVVGGTLRVANDQSTSGTLDLSASTSSAEINANYWSSAVPMTFKTGGAERMRIETNGNINCSSDSDTVNTLGKAEIGYCGHADHASFGHLDSNSTTGYALLAASNGTTYLNAGGSAGIVFRINNSTQAELYNNGVFGFNGNISGVGSAATVRIHLAGGTPNSTNTGVAAAWNVHSDYRLKENVSEITGAIDTVKALRPINFSWVEENEDAATTGGFLAHELDEHIPYAVLGEKDAVNENGDIIPQAADYSKVVPVLTAALQEAIAKIEDLETRLAAVEGDA